MNCELWVVYGLTPLLCLIQMIIRVGPWNVDEISHIDSPCFNCIPMKKLLHLIISFRFFLICWKKGSSFIQGHILAPGIWPWPIKFFVCLFDINTSCTLCMLWTVRGIKYRAIKIKENKNLTLSSLSVIETSR